MSTAVLKPAKDATEFFANKKRRGFKKFNANFLNATAVSRDVHVDAPALSTQQQQQETSVEANNPERTATISSTTTSWSDPVGAGVTTKPAAVISEQVRTLELAEDPNVVEKVQIEETKAQLAKAREGMERAAAAAPAPAPPAPTSRWMGARMRGGGQQKSLDVTNEQLFPDLSAAAPPQPVRKPKMAARPKKSKPAMPPMVKPSDLDQKEPAPKPTMKEVLAPSTSVDKGVVKKKKKKDLSTFGKK